MTSLTVPSEVLVPAGVGFVVASGIALAARRAGSLAPSGALAAIVVGTLCAAAGAGWGALLIIYFVAASLLSRYGRREKERLTGAVVAKSGARDITQVLANGGVYTACLVIGGVVAGRLGATMHIAALGALAASSADTWATEIGTLHGGTPRSIFTLRPVTRGTSGGVSVAGTIAMIAGAAFVAVLALLLELNATPVVVALGGIAGAVADSAFGATVQERRWCPTCAVASEQVVHTCGTRTLVEGGVAKLDNDAVNFLSTIVGGAVAALLASF